jgi:hypothetical protein
VLYAKTNLASTSTIIITAIAIVSYTKNQHQLVIALDINIIYGIKSCFYFNLIK